MAVTVAHLYEEALQLSEDARVDLAERLIESAAISPALLEEQLQIVSGRVKAFDSGLSSEIPGDEAHERVRRSISGSP
jgi:hypothetical protein